MTAMVGRRLGSPARAGVVVVLAGGLSGCGTATSPPEPDAPDAAEVPQASVDGPDQGARLVGTWRLARVERYDQTGAPLSHLMHPTIGLAPTLGFVMFDGERMAMVMQEEVDAAGTDGGSASDDVLDAVERYTSYFGPYVVDEARGFVSQQIAGSRPTQAQLLLGLLKCEMLASFSDEVID